MDFERARWRMVEEQLRRRDIRDERVLEAMGVVPRHLFVPRAWRPHAYDDTPLPLGVEQTISQPYIVAFMCEQALLAPGDRVFELGSGSGYQAAVLAQMGQEVYTIEIDPILCAKAASNLRDAGYPEVRLRAGDGYHGWPEAAPFQAILLTAAPQWIPPPLQEQLAEGGSLLAPLGRINQELIRLRRRGGRFERESLLPVRFVRMMGEVAGDESEPGNGE